MLLFGLTGGIASGKSTVASRFREVGLPVIDADQLARDVVARGTDGLAAVVAEFGEGVLTTDGELDRKRLAAVAFTDPARRKALNAIVHPRIGVLTAERASELAARGERVACYEAALLVENGVVEMFRPLVVVSAPEAVQIARTMARDHATEAEARARIAAQLPLEKKIAVADFVIENAGDLDATRARADEVLAAIRRRAG